MALVVSLKRRWKLAIVAIGVVVAAVLGFVVFREDPEDVPRLVVLRQEQVNGEMRVVFRFDAPKHRRAVLLAMSTVDVSTGKECRPVLQVGGALHEIEELPVFIRPKGRSTLNPPLLVEPRKSAEFSVSSPLYDVWRLSCHIGLKERLSERFWKRVVWCWKDEWLAPLASIFSNDYGGEFLDSDLITNAVPPAADAPRP
jgi:hypothetical protein